MGFDLKSERLHREEIASLDKNLINTFLKQEERRKDLLSRSPQKQIAVVPRCSPEELEEGTKGYMNEEY